MFKAAIFDMDGLMIDSERLTLDVYKIYMATLGLSITKEFYVTMTGRTLRDCKKLLKDEYGQDFDSDLASKKFIQCVQINQRRRSCPKERVD